MLIEIWQPISVLQIAGYEKLDGLNTGWIRKIKGGRFHAHIAGRGKIDIHFDKIIIKGHFTFHHSKQRGEMLRWEARRLKKL